MTDTGPRQKPESFVTRGGVTIERRREPVEYATAIDSYLDALDDRLGAVLSSNYEYPGRYTRWDIAIVDPPVMISARKRDMQIKALNARGKIIVAMIEKALAGEA